MKKFAVIAGLGLLASGAQAVEPASVPVFEAGALTLNRYSVIERLWTGRWRSAFWIPAHDDAAAAIAELTAEAGRLGADGVVDLHCLRDNGGLSSGFICYGLAIKLK